LKSSSGFDLKELTTSKNDEILFTFRSYYSILKYTVYNKIKYKRHIKYNLDGVIGTAYFGQLCRNHEYISLSVLV
jgi:hypothetical protein